MSSFVESIETARAETTSAPVGTKASAVAVCDRLVKSRYSNSRTRAISRWITSLWGETLPQVRNVFGFRHWPKSFIHYHNAFVQILPRIHFWFLAQSTSHANVTNPVASIMTVVADAESVSIVGRVKMNVSIIKREVNLGTSEVISCINFLHVLEISSQKCWIHCISRFPSVGHRCVSCDVKIL